MDRIRVGDCLELRLQDGEFNDYTLLATFKIANKLHVVVCMCGDTKPKILTWAEMLRARG